MLKYTTTLLTLSFLFFGIHAFGQEDLEDLFGENETTQYTSATFKESRVILGESIEQTKKGNLVFDIQHQFGRVNTGLYEFFGIDQANTMLGLRYGINPWLSVGIERTSFQKTVVGSIKAKVLRQSKGKKNMPISVGIYHSTNRNGLKWDYDVDYQLKYRMSYVNQIIFARKFNSKLSLQIIPSYLHRNLVERKEQSNGIFALGGSGRYKLTQRLSINFEYFYILNKQTKEDYNNALNLGIDIETGGHIFQLYISNGGGILASQFITQTSGDWLKGDIHFGFNISRPFTLVKDK